jgi:hypothetical protein
MPFENIFRYNLVGIDIDTRAKQLATFALLMKACQKDASFLDGHLMPNVLTMPEAITDSDRHQLFHEFFKGEETNNILTELDDAFELLKDAQTLGSIMKFNLSKSTLLAIRQTLDYWKEQSVVPDSVTKLLPSFRLILALTQKYTALVMNPPYMGSGRFDNVLSKYVKDNYPTGKADLFAVFMLLANNRLLPNGKYAMINMQSWMFLSSFEKLRENLLDTLQIDSLLHLGPHTFDELGGEVVQNVSFVVSNQEPAFTGKFYRLNRGRNCSEKEIIFSNILNKPLLKEQGKFHTIPSSPIALGINEELASKFHGNTLNLLVEAVKGLDTCDNETYTRLWQETNINSISFDTSDTTLAYCKKWYPYTKGGGFRKWYGLLEYVVNWQDDGYELRNLRDDRGKIKSRPQNTKFYFKEGITWSSISSSKLSLRYMNKCIFGGGGSAMFAKRDLLPIQAFLNSNIARHILKELNPSVNFLVGDILRLPILFDSKSISLNAIGTNTNIEKLDWDAHETSWDFKENPLVTIMKTAEGSSVDVLADKTTNDDCDTGRVASYNNAITRQQRKSNGRQPIVELPSANRPTVVSQSSDGLQPSSQQHDDDTITSFSERYEAAMTSLEELCQGSSDDVVMHGCTLEACVRAFEALWEGRFMQLHANEEELNRQFIDIYGLQDELTPDVPLSEITILQQGEITIE